MLRIPPLASISYTYAEGYEAGHFHQLELVSPMALASRARERGLSLTSSHKDLEYLDKQGALRPVAFHLEPHIHGGPYLARTAMAFTEDGYRPWREYAWDHIGQETITPLYSLWQLLYAGDALAGQSLSVHLQTLRSARSTAQMQKNWRALFNERWKQWKALDERWRPTIKLLVRLQNRYLPFVRGSSTMTYDPAIGDYVNPVEREVREFDAKAVAAKLDVSDKQVADAYQWLARRGGWFDPAEHLYLLMRIADRTRRERYRGDLRLAHDFYDAAQLFRHFYEQLAGVLLPDANEVDQPGLNERVLGHEPRRYYTREDLKTVLFRLNLYPHGVHLFVEGETEEALFNALFDFGIADREGVRVQNMHGVGNFNDQVQQLFEHLTDYARFTLLIADDEGGMAKYARQWVEAGLVPEDNVTLWTSLEEANFSDHELVKMVRGIGRRRDPKVRLRLTGKELRRRYEEHKQRAKAPLGLAEYLLKIAGDPNVGPIRGSKPKDLALEMAQLLRTEVRAKGWKEAAEKRPVLGTVIGIGNVL